MNLRRKRDADFSSLWVEPELLHLKHLKRYVTVRLRVFIFARGRGLIVRPASRVCCSFRLCFQFVFN